MGSPFCNFMEVEEMEYRINDYIDIQPLYENKVLVLNKINGQSFELGNKESAVLLLIDGQRTPFEISRMCEYFSEQEIISLEKQLFELDIISKKKQLPKLNLFKIKIPLFSPNKFFKDGILTELCYYIFITINIIFTFAGVISMLINLLYGIDNDKKMFIQSISSFGQFNIYDIIYVIIFFTLSLIFHEFGHMIVARKHKINVPDIGVMLYLLVPCAYTNLTFLNYCNNKKTKLKVFLAGSLSDCGLLGISMTLFHLYAPNIISKYFLFSALVCMMSIIGNLVITFKFDGYYILQTLLDVDNLKKTSMSVVVAYIGVLFSKFKNRDKKLDLRQRGEGDVNLEFLFSVIYIFLSVLYIPIMIGSGVIILFIQIGERML